MGHLHWHWNLVGGIVDFLYWLCKRSSFNSEWAYSTSCFFSKALPKLPKPQHLYRYKLNVPCIIDNVEPLGLNYQLQIVGAYHTWDFTIR